MVMSYYDSISLDHLADHLIYLSSSSSFWFSLNSSCVIVELPVVMPPSCPFVRPPSCLLAAPAGCCIASCPPLIWLLRHLSSCRPLVLLSLHHPLVVSSRWMVVALPLVAPSSCPPLTAPHSRCLALAGCCVASCCAVLSSSRPAVLSSSHFAPAGCCIASVKRCHHHQTFPSPPSLCHYCCSHCQRRHCHHHC